MTIRPSRQRSIILMMVAMTSIALALPAGAGSQVPFKGADVGTFSLPGACSDGSLQVVIEGSGTATHLGRYRYEANECFNPVTGAFSGEPTVTAANGDQLFGTYSGQVSSTSDPNVITYEEQLTVSGGTGRFAGATGAFDVVGEANLADLVYNQSLVGVISNLGRP